jgi:hypothetical protein
VPSTTVPASSSPSAIHVAAAIAREDPRERLPVVERERDRDDFNAHHEAAGGWRDRAEDVLEPVRRPVVVHQRAAW